MDQTRKKLISVVTPCYNEEMNAEECYRAVREIFARDLPQYDYEHIFCDNASTDDTANVLRRLAGDDPCVKVILNARNFGPLRSNYNGVMHTSGDAVVVFLPADLQDPPEVIVQLVRHWEEGYEIVYGIRAKREEGIIMRNVRKLYYRMVTYAADIHIPPDVGEFQLVDRVVVEALRQHDDYYPYLRGMIAGCGFRSIGVPYTWKARQRGISKGRLYLLIDQGLNGLISFTNIPMRLCMLAGLLLSVLSIGYALVSLVLALVFWRLAQPGIPTLIIAIFFFSGVQLFFLGVIGEYISAIHSQVRKRPLVVEREQINFEPRAEPAAKR
ncbi:MAG: glycosyltransferase family 2 protein [Planctomycetes bacterium]|nr:glycosyltransferase family 2 protein [Planctomycetota bacterium]